MTSVPVSVAYGSEKLQVQVPQAFLAGEVIRPRSMPGLTPQAILDKMREALAAPVGRPRLRDLVKARKVAVLISDEFRAGLHEAIIQTLAEELAQGEPGEVVFLCATGTHEPEVYAKNIGPWVHQHAQAAGLNYRFVAHSCDSPSLVPIGKSPLGTEVALEPDYLTADVRVYGHESKHHYMNGYSLVDKQVIPGISARRTVEMNHKRSLSDDSGPGRNPWHSDPARQANPFGQDARDIRHLAERTFLLPDGSLATREVPCFALDMISDKGAIYWVGAGDPDAMCVTAVRKADEQAQINATRQRYLLISPGGPPASQALYGVQNCFDMAMLGAVQPGGEVLIVAPCEGRPDLPQEVCGLATSAGSKRLFWDNLVALKEKPLAEAFAYIDANFALYIWKTWRVLKNLNQDKLKLYLHSQLPDATVRAGGFIPVADPQAWVEERAARGDGKLNVVDNGNKLFVWGA
jgi:nickel-dependent lactate racemase